MRSLGESSEDYVIKSFFDSMYFSRQGISWKSDGLSPAFVRHSYYRDSSSSFDFVKLNSLTDSRSVGTCERYVLTVPDSIASSDFGYTMTWNFYLMMNVDFLVACTQLEVAYILERGEALASKDTTDALVIGNLVGVDGDGLGILDGIDSYDIGMQITKCTRSCRSQALSEAGS